MAEKTVAIRDSIDNSLPTPLYHQLYVLIREKIFSGVYANGTLIPTEKALEKMFDVSRITVKRALDELAKESLVARQRGRGTTVTFNNPVSHSSGNMAGLIEDMQNIAKETTVTILEFDYIKAPPQAVDALKLDPAAIVQKAIRIRHKDQMPFSYVVTYLPEEIGQTFKYEELEAHPILALIERSGIAISRARQTITAALADSVTAPALRVNMGSPLIKVTRIVYDTKDKPVEYITIFYRPDHYQLNLDLSRVKGEQANFWTAKT
ncbi:MAG: GntR family transcriptional regulator [Alphaproteobacteria bacterium]|nr:MAG: GntR family transcriptional regulator [Alphaproteobacteria bacterium]